MRNVTCNYTLGADCEERLERLILLYVLIMYACFGIFSLWTIMLRHLAHFNLQSLRRVVWSRSKTTSDTNDCCICMEPLCDNRVLQFECSHKIHAKCASAWLQHIQECDDEDESRVPISGIACPMCRRLVVLV